MKKPHRELTVWQKIVDFIVHIYGLTEKFPKSELYSLTSQLEGLQYPLPQTLPKEQPESH